MSANIPSPDEKGALVVVEFDPKCRDEPPRESYRAPVRIDGKYIERTLELRFIENITDEGWCFLAWARFPASDSPIELLRPPNRFELVEGPHVVASGQFLTAAPEIAPSDTEDVPGLQLPLRRGVAA